MPRGRGPGFWCGRRSIINFGLRWNTLSLNPYRIFFPLGILFGLMGVGEWVLWTVGWKIPNIAISHAAFQSQGFLLCFVVGFLMTAFPRFTGTDPAAKHELILMLVASVVFFVLEWRKLWLPAQVSYLFLIINLIIFAARRIPRRNKDLPQSFLLMGFGFLHALLGSSIIVGTGFGTSNFALFSTGRQMVQLGFLLCMVLGVTGKLAPFLFGYTDDPERDAEKKNWIQSGRAAIVVHGLTGAAIMASFFIDTYSLRAGAGVRAVFATFHLLTYARIARPLRKKTTLMFFFFLSCWMIPVGLWVGFLWPGIRIAALHIIFLGGFSLIIFSFGLLIVLSHSMQAALINSKLIPLKFVGTFLLAALTFRLLAEFYSAKYALMLHFSSGFWVLAALVWGGFAFPKFFGSSNSQH